MKFYELDGWKEAHLLTLYIYTITKEFPKDELYGLTTQLRRAAVSIESNIAEGFNRWHFKDRLNFYYTARGSVGEVQTQVLIAKDLGYITKESCEEVLLKAEHVEVILAGIIKSTQNLAKK